MSFEKPIRLQREGLGSVIYGSQGGGGGQQALVSDGTGTPVFIGPNKIESLKELSGVKIAPGTGGNTGSVTFFNRLAYFFVDQFGAVGDGTTDDTVAIQAAFTAAGTAGRGVVFFPAGTYLISATINWPAVSIWACGSGAGLAGQTGISEILVNDDGVIAFSIPGNRCKVSDIGFTGPVGATSGNAINSSGVSIEVSYCAFTNFFDGLVQTQAEVSVVHGCQFRNQVNHMMDSSNSASADNGDCVTSDCYFTTNVGTLVGFFQQGSGGQKIHGCKFVASATPGQGFVNPIECDFPNAAFNTSDLLITNCSIEQFNGIGIAIVIGIGAQFVNVVIVGNQIGSFQGGRAIEISASGAVNFNNVITGNAIDQSGTGIVLINAGSTMLSGNLFTNVTTEVLIAGVNNAVTGFAGNDAAAPPVTPGVPAAWSDVPIYTPTGTVVYKMPLYL